MLASGDGKNGSEAGGAAAVTKGPEAGPHPLGSGGRGRLLRAAAPPVGRTERVALVPGNLMGLALLGFGLVRDAWPLFLSCLSLLKWNVYLMPVPPLHF